MSAPPDELRRIRGRFATGVTVVTASNDGRVSGLTVSAFAVVSLEPPLVLVCLDHASRTLGAVERSGRFGVNVLAEGQEELAQRFSTKNEEKIAAGAATRGEMAVPLLVGAHAYLECRVDRMVEGGDHAIVVGAVERARLGSGRPLLFYRGRYASLRDE